MYNTHIRLLLCRLALVPVVAVGQTVPLTQDTTVVPGSGINYGTAPTINIGGPTGAQGLIQFDLTALAPGIVAKATLVLFVSKIGGAGTVNISVANGSWTELTVSGTGATPLPGVAVGGVSVSTADAYVYADVTAAVQAWLNGSVNAGLILTPLSNGVNVGFDSKEGVTTSHPAMLNIVMASASPSDINALQAQITSLLTIVNSLQSSLQQQQVYSGGGIFSMQDMSTAQNSVVNPYTGQFSCPAGYTPQRVARVKGSEPPMWGVTIYLCVH